MSSIASRSNALRNCGSLWARSRIVSRKSLVSAMVFFLGLPVPVVFPIRLCLADVFLLAFLRATREQNNEPVALPSEVDAVAGTKINLVFENTVTNRFDVGQVTTRNPLKRRRHFRRGMNVECAQPLREGASSSGIDVFPNVEHDSIITYTLGLTVDSGDGFSAPVTAARPPLKTSTRGCGPDEFIPALNAPDPEGTPANLPHKQQV